MARTGVRSRVLWKARTGSTRVRVACGRCEPDACLHRCRQLGEKDEQEDSFRRAAVEPCAGCSRAGRTRRPGQGIALVTQPASSIATTGATLNGTVNGNGGDVSAVYFDYGPTVAYDHVFVNAVPFNVTAAQGLTPVSLTIAGLTCATTYHFRVTADDANGRIAQGGDLTFAHRAVQCAEQTGSGAFPMESARPRRVGRRGGMPASPFPSRRLRVAASVFRGGRPAAAKRGSPAGSMAGGIVSPRQQHHAVRVIVPA